MMRFVGSNLTKTENFTIDQLGRFRFQLLRYNYDIIIVKFLFFHSD